MLRPILPIILDVSARLTFTYLAQRQVSFYVLTLLDAEDLFSEQSDAKSLYPICMRTLEMSILVQSTLM